MRKRVMATFLVAAASLSSMLGVKSVTATVDIPAPPEQVWQVLMDTDAYSEWNPVLVPLEGELAEGNTLRYRFQQDQQTTAEMSARVKQIHAMNKLNQVGGYWGILTFDHNYLLEPIDKGTRLTIYEEYTGLGVHFWDPTPVEQAYQRLAESLKLRVITVN